MLKNLAAIVRIRFAEWRYRFVSRIYVMKTLLSIWFLANWPFIVLVELGILIILGCTVLLNTVFGNYLVSVLISTGVVVVLLLVL